jgi:hypothetical protein
MCHGLGKEIEIEFVDNIVQSEFEGAGEDLVRVTDGEEFDLVVVAVLIARHAHLC